MPRYKSKLPGWALSDNQFCFFSCAIDQPPPMTDLLLKSSGPVADQYKVLAGDQVVGHIRLSESAPPTTPWRWTLSHGQHKGRRTPTHGYGTTREEAMQAFARSWHRG